MIGRLNSLERSMGVVLLVRAGEVAAVEISVVLLPAMIGQRLSGNLPAGDAPPIGKSGDKQSVNVSVMLKAVQHRLDAFVNEGDGTNLNADGPSGRLRRLG